MRLNRLRTLVLLLLSGACLPGGLVAAPPAPAETPTASSPLQRLDQVEKELQELQRQVHHGFLDEQLRSSRLRVGAFGDADFAADRPVKTRPWVNRFFLGNPSFFLTGKFGDHLSFTDENLVEFNGTEVGLGLDRALIAYAFNRGLRVAAGRDRAATGFWNRTFGYAAIQQATIERPFFIAFEDDGGVLPSHLVGVSVDGTATLGGSELAYAVNLGNAPSLKLTGDGSGVLSAAELDGHLTGDGTDRKAVAGRLTFKPWATKGLSVGTSAYFTRLQAVPGSADLAGSPALFAGMGQLALEAEAVWRDETLELYGEAYLFNDQVSGAPVQGARGNRALYVQAGIHLTEHWMPYVRTERLRAVAGDPYFASFGPLRKDLHLVGVRIDLVPKVTAIKLEGRVVQTENGRQVETGAQWAFGF